MKNTTKTTALVAISTLVIGLFLGWIFFGSSNESDAHNHADDSSAETIWTCSMHPQIRQNEPGDCPLCGMDLIPLETTDTELDPMAISMSTAALQLAQVQTMVVGNVGTDKSIRLNGKVQVDERLLFSQSSHIPGRIEKLMLNFTGEFVSAGQVIAHVYSPELVTAQEELIEAGKIKESQPRLYNAAKEKLKNWKLTDQQIDQIASSNKTIEEFPIIANVSGYVTDKMVNLGDYIKQGEVLYEITDLSKVWVLFDVYESDMSWIKKGNKLSYIVQSFPGKTFDGTVSYIDPVIDPITRIAEARVEASNEDLLLKPEMFVRGTLEVELNNKTVALAVPKTAVMWTGKRSVVYVMQKVDQVISFKMREVTLGPALSESYVIESGLDAGEEIAVSGTFSIDAAAQLAGMRSMMNTDGGVAMTGHDHGNTGMNSIQNTAIPTKIDLSADAKKALKPLLDSYFAMKNALVEDDYKKASLYGKSINEELAKIEVTQFKGEANQFWAQQSVLLKNSTQGINELDNIAAIRENFIGISNIMINLTKTFNPFASIIYIQNCPMADTNNGADWLSLSEDIRNPYFGSSMLKCGEVKEVLGN